MQIAWCDEGHSSTSTVPYRHYGSREPCVLCASLELIDNGFLIVPTPVPEITAERNDDEINAASVDVGDLKFGHCRTSVNSSLALAPALKMPRPLLKR